uniref:Radial spoke head protein 3 homolog n=1 Tax=Pavo cristatus TaxID=9049 RepID=A0A8C9L715_PAVCR
MLPALRPAPSEASAVPYTYCSPPRAVPARPKYRAPLEEPARWANLMYDRRVVRGNTYARQAVPTVGSPRASYHSSVGKQEVVQSPSLEVLKNHVDVLYLEEISDRIIEVDVECQTDAFLDRPPTPFFVPAKTGRDVATQIEEGELFDFDIEVKPILEVLIGKTIEQALLEVMEEEELANLWAHQRAYAELRNAELAEVQRLEEQDRRYREEKVSLIRSKTGLCECSPRLVLKDECNTSGMTERSGDQHFSSEQELTNSAISNQVLAFEAD